MKINNVLIQDDKITPRNNWGGGRVEELIVSRDSKLRGAGFRVYNKKKDSTFLLKKLVQNLIPFEIMNSVKEDNKMFQTLLLIVHNERQP